MISGLLFYGLIIGTLVLFGYKALGIVGAIITAILIAISCLISFSPIGDLIEKILY